ncbi:MAG: hypothetical protein WKG01_08005 [Kofleriaceae bacterium]
MDDADQLLGRVEGVVVAAARAAARSEGTEVAAHIAPPAVLVGSRGAQLAGMLGLTEDELDFLWSVVARAIDARVGAHLRAVFGTEARFGLSIGQHAALRELPAARSHALLRVLDPRHPLRAHSLIEPVAEAGEDVDARWTAPARVASFLRGDDELDPTVAATGGLIALPADVQLSIPQRAIVDKLRSWLAHADARTIVLEGPQGAGRRTAIALALGSRRAVTIDFARVGLRDATRALTALRREATLCDAVPVLANLDELWSKVAPGDDALLALAVAIDQLVGPIVVTTSTPGLDLRAERRAILRAAWPVPTSRRRTLWSSALIGRGR